MRFSILLPVRRSPALLSLAIDSVLAQTAADFELLAVCDGAPPETVSAVEEIASRDPRVKPHIFARSDGPPTAHLHAALSGATGTAVAHLEDDNLWFPNHLEELGKLLETVDFGHTLHATAFRDGSVVVLPSDLRSEGFRERFANGGFNRIGLPACGYRLDAYRRLGDGWAGVPADTWPDLFMWRKFLAEPGLRFGTRMAVTALVVGDPGREGAPTDTRMEDLRRWFARVSNPDERAAIVHDAWQSVVGTSVKQELDGLAAEARHRRTEDERAAISSELKDARTRIVELEATRQAEDDRPSSRTAVALVNGSGAVLDGPQAQVLVSDLQRERERVRMLETELLDETHRAASLDIERQMERQRSLTLELERQIEREQRIAAATKLDAERHRAELLATELRGLRDRTTDLRAAVQVERTRARKAESLQARQRQAIDALRVMVNRYERLPTFVRTMLRGIGLKPPESGALILRNLPPANGERPRRNGGDDA